MEQNVDFFQGQQPLKGVVLCCTSLDQDERTNLVYVASQMGAAHNLDLTAEVTHLIVGKINTPKYRYVAKERPDVKVLRVSWIEAVRQSWMEGGDVEIEALEQEHRFPTFFELQICVTGFTEITQRDAIHEAVEKQGAVYHGDLTKVVTHLIVAAPEGAKYTHAQKWGITTVSLKWFEDSVERGMALDEKFYDPTTPTEEQGKDAFRRHIRQRTSLGKHGREDDVQNAGSDDVGRKKLRRTASTRLECHSQDMWSDMSNMNTSAEPIVANQWRDDEHTRLTAKVAEKDAAPAGIPKASATRNSSDISSAANEDAHGLLSGQYILIHGFEQSKRTLLQTVLEQNGATVVQMSTELENASNLPLFKARSLVIPHTASTSSIDLPDLPASTATTTEWWVERCIHYKQLLDPDDDVLSRPFWHGQVSGFSDLVVSTTGFDGVNLRQVAKAIKLMGAAYQETIVPSTSVLISGSTSIRKEKAFYASRHSIPVVSVDWLWTSVRTGKLAPFAKFELELPGFDLKELTGEASTRSPTASDPTHGTAASAAKEEDDPRPKRLSNVRKRHATPSLPLQATKTNSVTVFSKPKPIVHDDDNDDPEYVAAEPASTHSIIAPPEKGSQPLQELSPNRSPRRRHDEPHIDSQTTLAQEEGAAKHRSRSASPSKTMSQPRSPQREGTSLEPQPQPSLRSHHELAADLAQIINRRPSSATTIEPPLRKKSRPLGRASSGISNRSTSGHSQSHSFSALKSELPESVSHERSFEAAPPSTQLGYEIPEAEAHRAQLSKKLGLLRSNSVDAGDGMKRLASLGVVKDSGLLSVGAGVGNRVKGRKGR